MAAKGEGGLHAVMIPWLAFGHMNPFLQLSLSLADAGVHVSFASTTKNIQKLPKIPSHLRPRIRFVELTLPSVDGLPEGGDATVDIAVDQIQYLKVAYDMLFHPLKKLVADEAPDWILCDVVTPWAPDLGAPCIFFSAYTAAALAFFGAENRDRSTSSWESFTSTPQWIPFPSKVAYRPFEAKVMHKAIHEENASRVSDMQRFRQVLRRCEAVAVRSCNEFEGNYIEVLQQQLHGKPIVPVGLLPPQLVPPSNKKDADDNWTRAFKWLDEQAPKSVVFVSFGSECKLSKDQVRELADGIEKSQVPFLWVLRRGSWAESDQDTLPTGFIDRTKCQGVVIFGWAPQVEVLAHRGIGGLLFHSGWGTIVEALQHGLVLVLLPLVIDQGLNARLLVEKGLGVEVKRDEDGSFHGDDVAACLGQAMVSEEGKSLREKAREIGHVFASAEIHHKYMAGFVDYLLQNKEGKAN